MGAGVASIFASAFPEKLRGLICLDGLGPITGPPQEQAARLNKAVRLNTKSIAKSKTVYKSVEQAVNARAMAGDLSRTSVERLVDRSLVKVSSGYVWRSDSRLRLPSLYYFSEQQAQAYLSEIQIPTLLLRPVDSAYKAEKILKARADVVKNLTWIDIPGGHHAHMDQVDEVVTPIKNYIDKVMLGLSTV